MPDAETHATGPPERRSRAIERAELAALEDRLMAAIHAGDDATVLNLTAQMDARELSAGKKQEDVLARLDVQDDTLTEQTTTLKSIVTKLDSHAEFVRLKQEEDAEQLRQDNEQALRTRLLADIAKAVEDKRAARRARRNRVFPLITTLLAGLAGGTLLYAFDNLNHLLPEQIIGIAVIMGLLVVAGFVLYRTGP